MPPFSRTWVLSCGLRLPRILIFRRIRKLSFLSVTDLSLLLAAAGIALAGVVSFVGQVIFEGVAKDSRSLLMKRQAFARRSGRYRWLSWLAKLTGVVTAGAVLVWLATLTSGRQDVDLSRDLHLLAFAVLVLTTATVGIAAAWWHVAGKPKHR